MTRAGWLRVLRMFAPMLGRVPPAHLWYLLRRMRNEKPHRFAGQVRVNSFFPPWPSPAFDRFVRAVADRRRAPLSTYVAVTHDCPFRCPHCSSARRRRDTMSREQLLDLIARAKSLGACTLGLTGGEPLLRDDLEDLARAAAPEMAVVIFTTGHGLTSSRAQSLARAAVACVTVGIEAADPAAHDAVRGRPGSFDEAARAVDESRRAGLYTALSTVAFREKLASGELDRIYRLAADWGAGELRVLAPVATGNLARCAAAMLSNDELHALAQFHVRHNRRPEGPAVACFAYLESDRMFGCGAGYHHLFIDAAGEVCPCDLTPLSFGNATREPLADIWNRMGEFFSQPRCGCLMAKLAGDLPDESAASLPLPPEQSRALCSPPRPADPLPEGYRRLLRRPAP